MTTYYILIGFLLCCIIMTMKQVRAARKRAINELIKLFEEIPNVKR